MKTENVLLTGTHGDAKLADFGLCSDAQRIAKGLEPYIFAGTPNYQPEEVHLVNEHFYLLLSSFISFIIYLH